MKLNSLLFDGNNVFLWVLLLISVACSAAQVGQDHNNDHDTVQIDESSLSKLIDFGHFKTVFHKEYGSVVEEIRRMKIFLAKCLKAHISFIKYKLHESTSYRSINHMSDWTQDEWERTLMKPLIRPHVVNETTCNDVNSPEQKRDLSATGEGSDNDNLYESQQTASIAQKIPSDRIAHMRDSNLKSAQRAVHKQIYDVDHRECFNEVKAQDQCGACYVFAAISVLECHYYKAMGERISFSEQYALDCGEATCTGGYPPDIIDFSSEYGIDLADNFPYLARARKCTFGKPIHNKEAAGYFHVTGISHRQIKLKKLRKEIVNGPIMFTISVNDDFDGYRGGIDNLKGCVKEKYNHAMVLVGHGQENGVDFWLVRNSYSDAWGEDGYYRITQEALERCSVDEFYLVETDHVRFRRNRRYDLERIERLRQKWVGTEENEENEKEKKKKKEKKHGKENN